MNSIEKNKQQYLEALNCLQINDSEWIELLFDSNSENI